jgi:hypothetical protein
MIITRAQALGLHGFFAAEGSAYAKDYLGNVGAGVVDASHAPDSNDAAFIPLGTIQDWEHKASAKTTKTMAPNPSILGNKRVVTTAQELSYNFTTNEVTPLTLATFYRSSAALVQASAQFVPLSGKPPHGFLLLEGFSTEGDQENPYMTMLIWVFLSVTGGMDGGDNKILMPKFECEQLISPVNTVGTAQAS